jgi:hypothetical protein
MSKENRKTKPHDRIELAFEMDLVVELTAISTTIPHGLMRFSRSAKVLNIQGIKREERDFIIYHPPPRAPAYMTPARVYARGVCGYRFSPGRQDHPPHMEP